MDEQNISKDLVEERVVQEMEITVDPGQTPLRIDKYLQERIMNATRSKIQSGIQAGAITVGGKVVKPNYKVRPNDEIIVLLPKPQQWSDQLVPEDIPLDIRYEDDDVLVLFKPAGIVVHPGINNSSGTLVNGLAHYFLNAPIPSKDGSGVDRMGLVHRIDKNTSGLLVIGKNEYALSHLSKQFYHHTIDREYIALVWGEPEPNAGTIETYIGRSEVNRTKYRVWDEEEKGKWAVTHYEVIQPMYYVSLVKCTLETGRTHQIRVHMAHLNSPLFSDEKYGGDKIIKGTVFNKYKQFVENAFKICKRQALHARLLAFDHPRTGERMQFEAEMPEDMKLVIEKWSKYVDVKKEKL